MTAKKGKSQEVRYPVARNHPMLHAAPTFRPIQRGRRRRGLVRNYQTPNGMLSVEMMYELDTADQSLLFTILAMGRDQDKGHYLELDTTEENRRELLHKLELDLRGCENVPVHSLPGLHLTCTRWEMLRELGKADTKQNYRWLMESLRRLSRVGFFYDGKVWSGTFQLMSFKTLHETGEIMIALNPISAASIVSEQMGYINVHRQERAELKSDDAMATHAALCGLVSPGQKRTLNIDTLSDRVYAVYEDEVVSDKARRTRRTKVRDAVVAVGELAGWKAEIKGRGSKMAAVITRKSFKPK